MDGDIKALLGAVQYTGGDFAAYEFAQDVLESTVVELEFFGDTRGKFDDAVIEKWRPNFERVCHRHAVAFIENVVGEVIKLIEPEVSIEWPGGA